VLWFSYLFYFVCLCNATIRGERKITILRLDWCAVISATSHVGDSQVGDKPT